MLIFINLKFVVSYFLNVYYKIATNNLKFFIVSIQYLIFLCYLILQVALSVACPMRAARSGAIRRIPAKRTSAWPPWSPRRSRSAIRSATTTSCSLHGPANAAPPVRVSLPAPSPIKSSSVQSQSQSPFPSSITH